jgi:hypothetical protein
MPKAEADKKAKKEAKKREAAAGSSNVPLSVPSELVDADIADGEAVQAQAGVRPSLGRLRGDRKLTIVCTEPEEDCCHCCYRGGVFPDLSCGSEKLCI